MNSVATLGSAQEQALLWGARPDDWADTEARQIPAYEEAIRRIGIGPGDAVLDVGCGAGTFLRLASERGAKASGLDAAESLIAIAHSRMPQADLRVGDLQWLPYDDDCFDLVTGFNSFFFARDMCAALREAKRVAKPGASVLVQVWGRPERCDLAAMLAAVRALGEEEREADSAAPAPLWRPGVLEALAVTAGLRPLAAFDFSYAFEYPDEAALLRGMLSAGGVVEATQGAGEEAVARAIVESLASHQDSAGAYRLENEWRFMVAGV